MLKVTKLPFYLSLTLLSSCMGGDWSTEKRTDEFTGAHSCQVKRGSEGERDFLRGATGSYFTYLFFAENRDGEIRAGIMAEPLIPIAGDVQIKVNGKLITLTTADAPIDLAPAVPAYTASASNKAAKAAGVDVSALIAQTTRTVQQTQSPYRVLTGAKAVNLLREVVNSREPVRFRIIGVNAALSQTGTIETGQTFGKAPMDCGINI